MPRFAAELVFLPGDLELFSFLTGREILNFFAGLMGRPPTLQAASLAALGFKHEALDRKLSSYSTGMRQIIGIVCACQHDPDLLILDEPTTGLDPLVRESLLQWLRDRAEAGRTILFSSHVLAEVEACAHRVALIDQGVIKFSGALSELRNRFPKTVVLWRQNGKTDVLEFRGSAQELLARIKEEDPLDFEVRSADLQALFREIRSESGAEG